MPSLTELLAELGLGPYLVARTGFCIHPAAVVAEIPKVGGTKDVKLEKLRRLAPTHVVVNVDENRLDTVAVIRRWTEAPEIVVTHPTDPRDNVGLVDLLARTFAAVPEVGTRADDLKQALAAELELTRPEGRVVRRVLYLIWRDPWMTVARDTYIARMLARVGWQTVPAVDGGATGAARYPVIDGNESWLGTADEVLLSSEPYRFGAGDVVAAQALCPAARVRHVDGELLSWYGARAVRGLGYLRQLAAAP